MSHRLAGELTKHGCNLSVTGELVPACADDLSPLWSEFVSTDRPADERMQRVFLLLQASQPDWL
jgi:hypothetical protein